MESIGMADLSFVMLIFDTAERGPLLANEVASVSSEV